MSDFVPEHRCLTRTVRIAHPIERVFPLLTPEGERSWVEGWSPVYLSNHIDKESSGNVFYTDHDGEVTVWTVVEIDAERRRSRYVRHTEGSRTAMVTVVCQTVGSGTQVDVTYDVTGLTPAGNATVRAFETVFPEAIDGWGPSMDAVLADSGS